MCSCKQLIVFLDAIIYLVIQNSTVDLGVVVKSLEVIALHHHSVANCYWVGYTITRYPSSPNLKGVPLMHFPSKACVSHLLNENLASHIKRNHTHLPAQLSWLSRTRLFCQFFSQSSFLYLQVSKSFLCKWTQFCKHLTSPLM